MLSPPLLGATVLGARQYVRRGIVSLNLPHCSRHSRLKFFAKLFFKKAEGYSSPGERLRVIRRRISSTSLRRFFGRRR
ncbi:hypothetical protein FMM72_02125 [Anaerotruncus colihominis]|uniref:Uncharacterized protein n=1 Tax=Anaerotruncus colihominis TaxID=169435 RepID=A0A845SUC8_9FIRM|nr:hypothetical protein [Anaerotruncus colihominis]